MLLCDVGKQPPHPPPPRKWRPERAVRVAGGVSGKAAAGGAALCGGSVSAVPCPVSFRKYAGLTLSADTQTDLPRTESWSVFSLRERTSCGPL
jgi:hypothetical protein